MLAGKKISSPQEAFALLNCHRLSARLNTSEVAVLLGFQEHDIAPLVAAKLLTPLEKPAANAPKYFAAIEVLSCTVNRDWLSHATRPIAKHWATKNGLRASGRVLPLATRSIFCPVSPKALGVICERKVPAYTVGWNRSLDCLRLFICSPQPHRARSSVRSNSAEATARPPHFRTT